MKKILMLSTRYPFPVRKGDQVVINNRLLILQKKYNIDLVTFVKNSRQHTQEEKQFKNVTFHRIKFSYLEAIKKILTNLFKNEPFQIEIYNQKNYINYVNSLISKNNYSKIHYILIRSSFFKFNKRIPTLLDAVDSMQLNLQQIISKSSFFKKIIYLFELKRIKYFEENKLLSFDKIWCCSLIDRQYLSKNTLIYPTNFDPRIFRKKFIVKRKVNKIVFSGNLSYLPNNDALVWFLNIFIKIKHKYPDIILKVVGKGWHSKLNKLKKIKGIIFTGEVENLIDEIYQADLAVCPINIASGNQTKIIEYMGVGLPMVITKKALGGLWLNDNENVYVADGETAFYDKLINLIENYETRLNFSIKAKQIFLNRYSTNVIEKEMLKNYEK
jgi:glycosyltransferase involved in cell wall biosynthesis